MKPCQSAQPPVFGGAVPGEEDLLQEQSRCWVQGERLPVEAYLRTYPGLQGNRELVLDLICHELILRTRRGEAPTAEEYLRRFPDFAADLRAQFDVHQALAAEEDFRTPPDTSPNRSTSRQHGDGPVAGAWGLCDTSPKRQRGDGPIAGAPGLCREGGLPVTDLPGGEREAYPKRVADYEVLGELGRGAMGVVYLARQHGLKRLVALKMIQSPANDHPRMLARFRAEAEVLARLQHPNIVQIHEVGECEGRPFFALEYLPGGGLDRRLNGNPQPPRAAVQLLWALARAVDAAHQGGVIHRDLKPANVLLAADDTPKLTDFGLAKQLDGGAGQTNTGDILGTPHYMAPEQACGRRGAVGPWTDVYALGAILYELLTGRPPFNGATIWDTLEQVVSLDPVPPARLQAKVPRDLEVICLKCLEKEPARRYARATDLAEDFRRWLAGEPIRARPTPAWERAWRWGRRRPAVAALTMAGLLSALVLVGAVLVWFKAAESRALLEARKARDHEAIALSLADFREALHQVEASRADQRWKEAHSRLTTLIRQLRVAQQTFPAATQFGALLSRTEDLRRPIELGLTARERLRRFRTLRTEAGFLVMGLAGTDLEARSGRARQVVGEAFALFGAEAEAGPVPALERSDQPAEEQREVREGCCEMLLGLAQLAAESASGDNSSAEVAAVQRALALLDRAAHLGVAAGVRHCRRSRYLVRLGRVREARAADEQGQAHPPVRAFEFFLRGSDLYADGDLTGAVSAFETALSLEPNHAAAAYALALPHLRLRLQTGQPVVARGHLEVARMSLTTCLNQHPGLPWPYLCRAFALGELGEYQAADDDFTAAEQALRDRPDAAARYALLVSRGALRIRQGALTAAVEDLTAAVRLKPRDYQAHVNLSRAYQLLRQEKKALGQMDEALALCPPSARAVLHRTRARLHQEAGRIAAAVRDLDEAARLEPAGPNSPPAAEDLLAKGCLLAQSQDYPGAIAALDAALRARPNHAAALRARAEALLHLQRDADALRDLNCLLEGEAPAKPSAPGSAAASPSRRGRQPGTAPLYRARAGIRAKAGDFSGAIEDYTLALGEEPDHAAAHVGRGWAYLALDGPTLALADFDRAVRLDPKDGDAHNGRAYARVKAGRYQDAVDDAEQAIRLGPPTARHRYNAARVFAQAFLKAAEDDTLQNAQGRALRAEYQDRAVVLLRDALAALPHAEQSAFWTGTVQRDRALHPIRQSHAFQQLAARFAGKTP